MIYIFGPHHRSPKDLPVLNVTSRSSEAWTKAFSPFFLGPVKLYDNLVASNVENAWQYSKVYPAHMLDDKITDAYWNWAKLGWRNNRAVRYPMGKGAKPLFSLWDGQRLSYIEARKKIYIPLYSECVRKSPAWGMLQQYAKDHKDFGMWDFDGYDYLSLGMTLEEVKNSETRKMGHAFVLAMMLENLV